MAGEGYIKMTKIELNVGDLKAKRNVKGLIKALECEDRNIRRYAAGALGEVGDKSAIETLIQALKDEKWDVRWKAAEALGLIGDSRAVEPLIESREG